jgi:adenine-specific DNA-methyltransferase
MPNAPTSTPNVTNFDRLKIKLRELFELDKADLDFGIYRVLRQRHTEIAEFLDKHLEKTVREALTDHGNLQSLQLKQDLETAEAAAAGAGIAPEESPRVMELRGKLAEGADLEATADEVYSHLLTFFSRYYQSGDFLGLQRSTVHGRERYMIPYNGEEVKLMWANMDQYYIKSSELLRDYTFRIRKADLATGELNLDDLPQESIVLFKLVEGDTEKDNRKPDGKATRAFALDEERPFEADGNTLTIRFRYREHTSERNLQDKLNADCEKTLADSLPKEWKAVLFATDPTHKPKDKKDTRSILQKHLRSYTAKFSFDYFIHKDLGGFLRRELDFYVKNEVMHLDDIDNATSPKAEEYLSKIRAIRRCALPVIQMLTQLENFQKKLWLQKKFVVETRYCLTLDRVPDLLYPDICACEAQWQEWEELVVLSELNPKRTPDFLKANSYLMLDTRHFSRDFMLKLLASIENLDASLDGVCFHSENFQALQLMQERYRQQVKCVYIDPPYNTDASPIIYKNGYKASTWNCLIKDRLVLARELLSSEGDLVAAIDDEQQRELNFLLSEVFKGILLGTICVRANPSGRPTQSGYSVSHEYLIIAGKTEKASISRLPATDEQMARFSQEDEDGVFEWRNLRREGSNSDRSARPYLYYPIYINKSAGSIRVPKMQWDDSSQEWVVEEEPKSGEKSVLPDNDVGEQKTWRWEGDTVMASLALLTIRKDRSGRDYIYYKRRPHDDGVVSVSSWFDAKYSATEHGTALLKDLFGRSPFSYPKSIHAVVDAVFICGASERNSVTVDFFGGSGTTGHAVINLNRKDKGHRKYLLAEMGQYFDSVLVPRLKKVIYSSDWEDGKPRNRDSGISHAFKIVRLESYEDTLNNLRLHRASDQERALAQGSQSNRDQYLLSYFLDVESTGSKSLLDLAEFRDPFAYKLNIATSSAGETKETTVDLVETFNWLIGLKVKHIDTAKGFLTVTGEKRAGGRCLILWRTLSANPKVDNESLEKFLTKLAVNPADTEFEFIYVNGAHTLNDPHNKVHLIEETFQRLMFDATSFESLS